MSTLAALRADKPDAALPYVQSKIGDPNVRCICVVAFGFDNNTQLRSFGIANAGDMALVGAWFLADANRMTETTET